MSGVKVTFFRFRLLHTVILSVACDLCLHSTGILDWITFSQITSTRSSGWEKDFFLRWNALNTWISVSKMGYLSKSKHAFGIKDNTTQRWLNNLKELPQYCYRFCTKTTRILQNKIGSTTSAISSTKKIKLSVTYLHMYFAIQWCLGLALHCLNQYILQQWTQWIFFQWQNRNVYT